MKRLRLELVVGGDDERFENGAIALSVWVSVVVADG